MTTTSAGSGAGGLGLPHQGAASDFATTSRLARDVMAELLQLGVVPTPRNYELWFVFRSGANPMLSDRLAHLLQRGAAPAASVLEALCREFLGGADLDVEAASESAGILQEAAQSVAEDIASSQEATRNYGDVLQTCARDLDQRATVASLVDVVARLTSETTRAVTRSHALEQRLSASAARVHRLRQSLMEVKQEALTDALTGIANRKAFDCRLKRAMAQVRVEPTPLSVLLLDIDHFKRFNDLHGHKTGDLVLRLVGRILRDSVKGRDTAARYGGEEFAVLLAGAELRSAAAVARQICAAIGGKQLMNKDRGQSLGTITLSIGVAQFRDGDTLPGLVARADQALYVAKRTGRNRVCTEAELGVEAA